MTIARHVRARLLRVDTIAFLLLVFPFLCGAAFASSPEVSTIAGSGAIGFADGPSAQATFSMPSDIVRSKDGMLFISDEAAQRIRALTRDGLVRTVAGAGPAGDLGLSVMGGYQDGPAAKALFNHPLGMAIGPDGALYIADSKNACIRKLQAGVVTTVLGVPGSSAPVDGPILRARLVFPHALAFDAKGRLWIADYGVGLRRLDLDGTLTTVALHSSADTGIVSISISPDADDPILLAVTLRLVFVYHLATQTDTYFDNQLPAEGAARPFGTPIRVIAIGKGQALFTDGESNNVRYLRLPNPPFLSLPFTTTIAGGNFARGIDNAGLSDGSRFEARFYSPRGLVKDGAELIVVDSGNRKLRRLTLPNFRLPETGLSTDYRYDDKHFEVAYVGPSVTFWDSFGDDSICATIETRLNRSGRLRQPARCHTVRIDGPTVQQIFDYIANYLSFQPVDIVMIPIDPGSAEYPEFHSSLGKVLKLLNKRTRLVMVWQYNYFTFSDDESLVQRETVARLQAYPDEVHPQVLGQQANVKTLLSGLPVFAYDSFDDFLQYERQPNHLPLYENPDTHFNPRGNAFMGNHLSDFILNRMLTKDLN